MMSRQMSTHSSQMNTVGPAISFLTSRWLLLQKLHLSASSPVSFFGIGSSAYRAYQWTGAIGIRGPGGWMRAEGVFMALLVNLEQTAFGRLFRQRGGRPGRSARTPRNSPQERIIADPGVRSPPG